jgi:hypothetical protein
MLIILVASEFTSVFKKKFVTDVVMWKLGVKNFSIINNNI